MERVVAKQKRDLRQQMEEPWFKAAEKRTSATYRQFGIEIRKAHDAMVDREDYAATWRHLERAHILSQSSAWRHLCIHFVMFIYAIMRREIREALGQVPRMILAVPSSLLGLAPLGNTGRSSVGLFATASLPKDLETLVRKSS